MNETQAKRYELVPGVRLKGLPEQGYLMVFTPERPKIQWFNTKAWLILELSRAHAADALPGAYADALEGTLPRERALCEFEEGLALLLTAHVLRPAQSQALLH